MSVGGLLSGFIGGAAEGVDQVAKLSLEERAQKRKEDLQMKLARTKGGSGKGGSRKGWGTDTRTIDIDGEKVERMYRYNKDTGQVEDIITSTDLARYQSPALRMFEAGMSPTEVEAAIMNDPDASKYYIPGTVFQIHDRFGDQIKVKPRTEPSGEPSTEEPGYSWTDFIPETGKGEDTQPREPDNRPLARGLIEDAKGVLSRQLESGGATNRELYEKQPWVQRSKNVR